MALTTTNAQISIQDGASAAVNLTAFSQIGFFTPGNQSPLRCNRSRHQSSRESRSSAQSIQV